MHDFAIADYLRDREKTQGKCKACGKDVSWGRERVAAHKRTNCSETNDETKRSFQGTSDSPTSSTQNTDNQSELSKEILGEIDSKLAKLFLRTGIAFRVVDSYVFKEFVEVLNPEYAKHLPSSKTLSGKLLDQQYENYSGVMKEMLQISDRLTLVSDGWTNVRGDHIFNFCISSPSHVSCFYKSL
jgi:Protein of unknown function (DUF 659)